MRGLTRLDRASLRHWWSIQVIAEPFGRRRHRGKRRRHAPHGPYRDCENDDRHNPHREQELPRKGRAALGQSGRERKPLTIWQRDRYLQFAETTKATEAAEPVHHRTWPHHRAPATKYSPVQRRCRHTRL